MACFKSLLLLSSAWLVSASIDPTLLPGHMKPFGMHQEPMQLEETDIIPDAKTFFKDYVLPSRPIVFRGAAKKFNAYSAWTEDYLVKKYGDLEVRLENKLEKEGFTPAGSKGIGRDTIREFINTYHNEPKYIVSELPSPMYEDMKVLPCMSCGPIKNRMVEIDLWMSSGSSQSILHKDAFNTMNCLINGTKNWKLVLYKNEKDLYKAYEEGDPAGGYSRINVRSVDMQKYPKIATLPYYNITVEAGDCLFLPKSCYHQVNSPAGFNLAVTILFSRFDYDRPKNFKNCNTTTEQFTPMTEFDIDWQYPGTGYMTMGYSALFQTKSSLLMMMSKGVIAMEALMDAVVLRNDPFTGRIFNEDYVHEIFGVKRGEKITKRHILALKKHQLRKIAVMQTNLFASNSYDYEYNKIQPSDVARLLSILIKQDGVVKRDPFVDGYVKKLYGTKLYGDSLFDALAGNDAKEATKDVLEKSFLEATQSYIGDDAIEDYDVNAKHNLKDDRGDAYIFVKKDLKGLEDREFTAKLIQQVMDNRNSEMDQGEEDSDPEVDEAANRELADGEDDEEGEEPQREERKSKDEL